jgi:hypothetical protein
MKKKASNRHAESKKCAKFAPNTSENKNKIYYGS